MNMRSPANAMRTMYPLLAFLALLGNLSAQVVANQFRPPLGGEPGYPQYSQYRRVPDLSDGIDSWLDFRTGSRCPAGAFHPGLDYNFGSGSADQGHPVLSIADGVVVSAGFDNVAGNYAIIEHTLASGSKIWSQYIHLEPGPVGLGAIGIGDPVGTIGNTGTGAGSQWHLHFELRKSSHPDPKNVRYWPCDRSKSWVTARYYDPDVFFATYSDSATTPSPEITEVGVRDEIFANPSRQWITIRGRRFVDGFSVVFEDVSNGDPYPEIQDPDRLAYINDREICVFANVGIDQAQWSAMVINPNRRQSKDRRFTVVAACPINPQVHGGPASRGFCVSNPGISEIGENDVVPGNSSRQWIPLRGIGFQPGFTATFEDLTNGDSYPEITSSSRLQYYDPGYVEVLAGVGDESATWSVVLHNADGSSSSPRSFVVDPSPAEGISVVFESVSIDDNTSSDSEGNDNGMLDVGELVGIRVSIENTGISQLTNISGRLTVFESCATVIEGTQGWDGGGSLNVGEVDDNDLDFYVKIAPTCPLPHTVPFTLRIQSDQGEQSIVFGLNVGGEFFSPAGLPRNPSPRVTATEVGRTAGLQWSSGGETSKYRVFFGTDSSPDQGELLGETFEARWELPDLDFNQVYYWRVDAQNTDGDWTTGSVWSFTTLNSNTAPCIVDLDAPAPNAMPTFPITFSWDLDGPCPNTLRIVFSNVTTGQNLRVKPVSGESVVIPEDEWVNGVALPPAPEYYWSIGFVDSGNVLRALTPWRAFTPVLGATCQVGQSSPSDGSEAVFPATFSWSLSGTCPDKLRIVFSNQESGGSIAFKPVNGLSAVVGIDEWVYGVVPHLGSSPNYFWSIGFEDDDGQLHALTPFSLFTPTFLPPCRIVQQSPSNDDLLEFPELFQWATAGNCPPSLRLVFSTGTSGQLLRARPVSGEAVSISLEEFLGGVASALPPTTTYYWSIGHVDTRGRLRALTDWQSFSIDDTGYNPALDITRDGQNMLIHFTTFPGYSYRILRSSTLNNDWVPLISGLPGSGARATWRHTGALNGASSLYYRLDYSSP